MKRKMLLFGLDGGTLNVLRPLADRGIIPFFAKLMKNGLTAPLRSTIPFVSPTAWASFITGKNPGKHGVFDFQIKKTGEYKFQFINASYSIGIRRYPLEFLILGAKFQHLMTLKKTSLIFQRKEPYGSTYQITTCVA